MVSFSHTYRYFPDIISTECFLQSSMALASSWRCTFSLFTIFFLLLLVSLYLFTSEEKRYVWYWYFSRSHSVNFVQKLNGHRYWKFDFIRYWSKPNQKITKGPITWRISARLGGGWDFSPASETNPLEMKLAITWRRFQPGLKFSLGWKEKPGWNFQTGWKSLCNRNGISALAEKWTWHAQWLCFGWSVGIARQLICMTLNKNGWIILFYKRAADM